MIIIKNKKAIEKMVFAGKALAGIMNEVKDFVFEGNNTLKIDDFIEKRILSLGLKPECKGYAGYKHASCISLNDVVVHGVPSDKVILKSGDFVKIDVVASYKGYCVDMARYFFVGDPTPEVQRIAKVSIDALNAGIEVAKVGAHLFDISANIQKLVESHGFNVVRDFAGHGIGRNMHEEPDVPNFGVAGSGPVLREGMTLAVEPMITQGGYELKVMEDGWTAKTQDGRLAAHVEDTILITKDGPRVLTRM